MLVSNKGFLDGFEQGPNFQTEMLYCVILDSSSVRPVHFTVMLLADRV